MGWGKGTTSCREAVRHSLGLPLGPPLSTQSSLSSDLVLPAERRASGNTRIFVGADMTNPATTSLLDRANLDRDSVRHEVARGLAGADDGELFLEYSQTEALMFDNGRLKQATYDTSQGFGLRAVKDDAVGYAHS